MQLNEKKVAQCHGQFVVKGTQKSKNITVEGLANAFIVDRANEVISPDAWDLKNYLLSPIILFNHDEREPVGRALEVRETDGGLWIKVKMSNSQNHEISRIRDLVEEGILKSFSVGFRPLEENQVRDDSGKMTNVISKAELLEVSIVSIPCNPESCFDLSTRSFSGLDKNKSIDLVLQKKGASSALKVRHAIANSADDDKIIKQIKKQLDIADEGIKELLSGYGEVTGLDEEKLNKVLSDNQIKMNCDDKEKEESCDKGPDYEKIGEEELSSEKSAIDGGGKADPMEGNENPMYGFMTQTNALLSQVVEQLKIINESMAMMSKPEPKEEQAEVMPVSPESEEDAKEQESLPLDDNKETEKKIGGVIAKNLAKLETLARKMGVDLD